MYLLKILIFQTLFFSFFSKPDHNNPSPRTGPQDLLVTHFDCEENEQKTLHKYAINQVTQFESEPQSIETTNIIATLYSKAAYDLHDKNWIPQIGINNPSNCKADTKNKGYLEIMFFDW